MSYIAKLPLFVQEFIKSAPAICLIILMGWVMFNGMSCAVEMDSDYRVMKHTVKYTLPGLKKDLADGEKYLAEREKILQDYRSVALDCNEALKKEKAALIEARATHEQQ